MQWALSDCLVAPEIVAPPRQKNQKRTLTWKTTPKTLNPEEQFQGKEHGRAQLCTGLFDSIR